MLMPSARKPKSHEPTKGQYALRGLVVLVAILVALGLIQLRAGGAWGGPPEVSADLRNAGARWPAAPT
jgi:ABC-type transporter Mla subunit MlaD